MRPIFTIHAGEYLVGSYIEERFKNKGWNVWIPSKDTGIDLLITDKENTKSISVQVKFSKDYWLKIPLSEYFKLKLKSCGWWKFETSKIAKSRANFWILVLYNHNGKDIDFIIIEPNELLRRLKEIHGDVKKIQHYLWVTQENKCWETRTLLTEDQKLIAEGEYSEKKTDFTQYLNNWDPLNL